jgi:hypothetical protein
MEARKALPLFISRQFLARPFAVLIAFAILSAAASLAQSPAFLVDLDRPASPTDFALAANGAAAAIYVAPGNPETVRTAAAAFASDVEQVTGIKPRLLTSLAKPLPANLILVGVLGHSPEIDQLVAAHKIDTAVVAGKWESALTTVVSKPLPGVSTALVIAASDRRGAAFALFTLSRQMGVSPWTWWADVPIPHHAAVYVRAGAHVQPEPSVQYRGIFLNDEDWGLRPWAAKKMDPQVDSARGNEKSARSNGEPAKGNIGPNTYVRIFELLLRLHANSLWPAMHPGSLAFNAVPENAELADQWGIVMGSSHSEALLRNNVGEWSEKAPPAGDGPWNYQTNAPAMSAYWERRLIENGKYENFYTVGLRGLHDSGLETKGTPQVKAKLVEDVMMAQRSLLAKHVSSDLARVPQVIWLYKESLDLYRVGMKVPDDVTLGWTDDNYGYIRELPNAEEQKRTGGSGIYYHVSYWGAPHDYLWLSTTPPALIREEMTKAYDHNARKYWILNVGDLKPAEIAIDYFMQLATDEPRMAAISQRDFLTQWTAEQFPIANPSVATPQSQGNKSPGAPSIAVSSRWVGSSKLSDQVADVLTRYYNLNFIRKPEFMGFNGYNDAINRTSFNPLAWDFKTSVVSPSAQSEPIAIPQATSNVFSSQNLGRAGAWAPLRSDETAISKFLPQQYASAFFELVAYPIEASAAQNEKFLATDLTYLDTHNHDATALAADTARAHTAYDTIQSLTAKYNALENGKWDGMMSADPRQRHVFEMPLTATMDDADKPLPTSWSVGDPSCPPASGPSAPNAAALTFTEQLCTVSINASHFVRKSDASAYRAFSANDAKLDPAAARWNTLDDLGISGASIVYGAPGLLAAVAPTTAAASPWLDYDFTTATNGPATLALHLLPTFPVDSDHRLRYAVSLDGATPIELDAAAPAPKKSASAGDGPANSGWAENVLRNSAIATIPIGTLAPGKHTLRLLYRDPGVVFEHLVLTFPGAPPAYPVPPETR